MGYTFPSLALENGECIQKGGKFPNPSLASENGECI